MALTDSQIKDRIYGEIVAGGMSIDNTDYSFSSIEAVKSWVAKNGDIPQEAYIKFRNSTYTEVELLYKSLNKPNVPPVVAETKTVNGKTVEANSPKILNEKDKSLNGDPTISILASGNANKYPTGLKKSNDTVAHVCNMPMIVMRAINMAGAMGGQIVMAIRKAIKAVLAALNINPSGNGIVSYLKKIANYIKDMTKFIKDITKFINGLVIYVNMIKQLIQYILSLPAKLIEFFKDCLKQAYDELKKGYLDALSSVAGTDGSSETIAAAKDVMNQTSELIKSSGVLVSTTASVAGTLTTLDITGPTANTQQINQAVTEVFSAAGYGPNDPSKYGRA